MAWGKACLAEDARPVDAQALALLRSEKHRGVRVALHPSVFVVASRFPIVTIWRNNQPDGEVAMIDRWRAESALVAGRSSMSKYGAFRRAVMPSSAPWLKGIRSQRPLPLE